ncbi:MAG TPA: penicillin-binding protein 2 [Draconibacterium sp.]|nr:penicillin-binding protein 2 [Draconibacterium sp.]
MIVAVFAVIGLVFLLKLFRLQILDPTYKEYATNNVLREVVQYPARGLVFDRNGKLLVYNKAAYDLLITPREVDEFDTLYLCNLLDISKEEIELKIQEAKDYSWYKPSILVKQISPESFAILQEKLYKYKGFHTQSRTLREYTYNAAAHVLGYVGEVTNDDIKKDPYYSSGDYIGVSGIEKTYEEQLRGTKGIKKYLVDVHNRIQGSYRNGREDVPAQIGKNVYSTLDIDLQLYAEKLLQNKKGGIVAIEPSTGEVLAMASTPSYDPRLLVGRVRGSNYAKLIADTLKPLFNRALMAEYPPGSTFKVLNVLVGLQEQAINLNTRFTCNGPASVPIKCTHYHVSPLGPIEAIKQSCNPFMWNTFRSIINHFATTAEGFNEWRKYTLSFGLGQKLNTDFTNVNSGNIPTVDYYNRFYGAGHWSALTVRSLAIGQGEIGITPLQLANYCTAVANRGFYYIPHIVKDIQDGQIPERFQEKKITKISPEYFPPVIEGMQKVVEETSASVLIRIPGITMCGKTGTAQNPHGEDHAVFMAFAPKDDPKIAISVYVENSGYGATYAAPIASLLVEKYLNGEIAKNRKWLETRMMNINLINPNQEN